MLSRPKFIAKPGLQVYHIANNVNTANPISQFMTEVELHFVSIGK